MPTSFNGIDHLKLPCTDIHKAKDFYTTIFPFTHIEKYNHYTPEHALFAYMIGHGSLTVELRHVPEQAAAQRGWDPITWGVGSRKDLEEWASWFEAKGVKHSRIFTGIKGWVMGCEDPDGMVVRLYVQDEEHEWIDHPDQDDYWLGKITPQT